MMEPMVGAVPRPAWALVVAAIAAACASEPPSLPGDGSGSTGAGTASLGADGSGGDGGPGASNPSDATGVDATGADDAGTASGDGPGPTTGPDPTTSGGLSGDDQAFRFNYLRLLDPHLFYGPIGDVTHILNDQFFVWLDPTNGDDDGNMEAGLALVFRPLDQSDGATGMLEYWNADCPVAEGGELCLPAPNKLGYITDYTSMANGTCLEPDPSDLDDELDPPPASTGPCFVNDAFDVIVETGNLELPLQQAQVSARYVGDPSLNLVSGLLRGYLTEEAAQATSTTVEVLGTVSLDTVLRGQDMDGNGWWLYFEFTALAVDWGG